MAKGKGTMSVFLRRRIKVGSEGGGGTPPVVALAPFEQGYAFYQGTTTGGGTGPIVHVYNYADLKTQLQSTSAVRIVAHGQINGTSATVNSGYNCESNKTLVGAPGCVFNGFGLSWFGKTNVIIRNIKFQGMPDFAAAGVSKRDYITLYGTTRVVINHCHFVESVAGGTDSHLDIIEGSDFITVSDCFYFEGDKGTLIGASDNAPADVGKLHVSMFRNRFVDLNERQPSYRAGTFCHVMNQLHESPNTSFEFAYGSASRNAGSVVRVENCDFSEFDGRALQSINGGRFATISSNILGPNAVLDLEGTTESGWTPPYEFTSYRLAASAVKSTIRLTAGANLTLEQMGF